MVSYSAKLDHRTKQHTQFGVSASNGSRDMARTKVAEKKIKKKKNEHRQNYIASPTGIANYIFYCTGGGDVHYCFPSMFLSLLSLFFLSSHSSTFFVIFFLLRYLPPFDPRIFFLSSFSFSRYPFFFSGFPFFSVSIPFFRSFSCFSSFSLLLFSDFSHLLCSFLSLLFLYFFLSLSFF